MHIKHQNLEFVGESLLIIQYTEAKPCFNFTKNSNSNKKYFVDYDMQSGIWTGFSFYLLLASFLSHQCVTHNILIVYVLKMCATAHKFVYTVLQQCHASMVSVNLYIVHVCPMCLSLRTMFCL